MLHLSKINLSHLLAAISSGASLTSSTIDASFSTIIAFSPSTFLVGGLYPLVSYIY